MMKKAVYWFCILVIFFAVSVNDVCHAEKRIFNGENGAMLGDTKRISGEVFLSNGRGFQDSAKCTDYQVYLLQNEDDHEGKLILDAKESSFAIDLTISDMEKYSLVEFVSQDGAKTIAIKEFNERPLRIVLQREMILKKPAIYLYPSQKTEISVVHHFKGKLLNTYPLYLDGWSVVAEPNGNLYNLKDGRAYKYLFWEGAYSFSKEHYQYTSGFYVKKENYVPFLQEKLMKIGMNENEINDFIVYWLPMMGKYNSCFVYFRVNDNIDGSSILETNPAPDTAIRVFMEFSGIEQLDSVQKLLEQKLPSFKRNGFTLVEWGGSEIGGDHIE
ncbi:MAG: hypothetical protein LLG02_15250 [Pelosinus sp.]|nr:hypothetical protein [Pelosinus sp.]